MGKKKKASFITDQISFPESFLSSRQKYLVQYNTSTLKQSLKLSWLCRSKRLSDWEIYLFCYVNPQTSKIRSSEYIAACRNFMKRKFTSSSQTVISSLKVMTGGSIVPLNVESLYCSYSRGTPCHIALRQTSEWILAISFLNCSLQILEVSELCFTVFCHYPKDLE